MKITLFCSIYVFLYGVMLGVTNAELSQKFDLILKKVNGLEERVDKLETENLEVKRDISKVEKLPLMQKLLLNQ